MSEVRRYPIVVKEDGAKVVRDFVSASDYDALKNLCDELVTGHAATEPTINRLIAERDELAKALREAVSYVDADSSETFAELGEWRALLARIDAGGGK